MKNNFSKLNQNKRTVWKTPKNKKVNRFWDLATRLEHRNISGKKGR
jgi:hypothetical protein